MTATTYDPQCSGKYRYDSKASATVALGHHRKEHGSQMQAYRCPRSEAWHIGHKPGTKKLAPGWRKW